MKSLLLIFIGSLLSASSTLFAQSIFPVSLLNIALNPSSNIGDRLQCIHTFGDNLSRAQVNLVLRFLEEHPDSTETNLAGLRYLKNEMMLALRRQKTAPPLTTSLISIYDDRSQDFVTRDYALQHLVEWYNEGAVDAPDAKARIRETLKEAVYEPSSLAGTALLGLHRLSLNDADFDGQEINRDALRLAASSGTEVAARLTAVQVCAERQLKCALPVIERLATERGHVALQISAIAALRRMGGEADVALLRGADKNVPPLVHAAIIAALRKMPQPLILGGRY